LKDVIAAAGEFAAISFRRRVPERSRARRNVDVVCVRPIAGGGSLTALTLVVKRDAVINR
jgi:hypothetical protein